MKINKLIYLITLFHLFCLKTIYAENHMIDVRLLKADIIRAKTDTLVNINATMLNGTKFSFDQWKGKVIYVDFWASWCAPCRSEMKVVPDIKKHFQGTDVVFLYISIDTNESAWKNAIEKDTIEGEHAIVLSNDLPRLLREVITSGIPRYMIIGRDGQHVNTNALKPSESRLLIKQLENALNNK